MQLREWNNIKWLEFDLLSDIPHLKHAVFLRHGGCSQGLFDSLNTGFHVGDNSEHVLDNLTRIEKVLKMQNPDWIKYVTGRGCHGKSIAIVNQQSSQEIIDFDGLITNTPKLTLMMKHADCQVAFFYDPQNQIIANIHSGWRGSIANIYGAAVQQMKQVYGSNPADLLVCITPSLGPDEGEFINYRLEFPEEFWDFQVRPTYFDFWSISEFQLQVAGILPHHIEIARLSTYSNQHDFFSYRRDKMTGRHASCITLHTSKKY